jgi:hypothetical protein
MKTKGITVYLKTFLGQLYGRKFLCVQQDIQYRWGVELFWFPYYVENGI